MCFEKYVLDYGVNFDYIIYARIHKDRGEVERETERPSERMNSSRLIEVEQRS